MFYFKLIFNRLTLQYFLLLNFNLISGHANGKGTNTEDNHTPILTSKSSTQENDAWIRATASTYASRAKITDLAKLKEIIREQQKTIDSMQSEMTKLKKECQKTEEDEDAKYLRLTSTISVPLELKLRNYSLKELTPNMPEYSIVTTYIDNSNYAADKQCKHDVKVLKIYAVQYNVFKRNKNVYLPVRRDDTKFNRHLLFHGTKIENVPAILKNGFSFKPGRVTVSVKQ
ncbi:poly(ADP-ribose) polymerase catalytic domain-containing protein [Ditylenchus destructor]|nr:poly(ADP-ribose) polymerase catalytic domain-containing protein [Ditylenchus destructor]